MEENITEIQAQKSTTTHQLRGMLANFHEYLCETLQSCLLIGLCLHTRLEFGNEVVMQTLGR